MIAASADASGTASHLLPFFGSPAVLKTLSGEDAEVTAISPPARMRAAATTGLHTEVATPQERKSERARGGHKVKPERVKRATAGEPSPFMMFGF